MKLTPEELREIAERETINTEEIRKAFIKPYGHSNPEEEEIVPEELAIYDLCEALDRSRTDIPRLLDHIKALEEENERYKKVLKQYAARTNWAKEKYNEHRDMDIWCGDGRGRDAAENALKGANNQ